MAFDYLYFATLDFSFDGSYNGSEQVWGAGTFRGIWDLDTAMIPPGAGIRLFGQYLNDPGINATVRAYYNATPDILGAPTLLATVPLTADQGYYSVLTALPVLAGQGYLVMTLETAGANAGLNYPGISFDGNPPAPPAQVGRPKDQGGFGSEAFGDPFGAGGPLHVVRARAVEGQTLRVVFDEEPIHLSAAGLQDALNPANYDVRIVTGQGVDPQVVGVKRAMVVPPAPGLVAFPSVAVTDATNASPIVITTATPHGFTGIGTVLVRDVLGNAAANGLWEITVLGPTTFSLDGSTGSGAYTSGGLASAADERGFDIQVDRPLIRTLTYEVTVVRVLAKAGGTLGLPYSARAVGIVQLANVVAPSTVRAVNDLANDPVNGGYTVDSSGDLALQDQTAAYKKRVIRRLMTPKDAFRALPGYGLGQDLKKPMSVRRLAELKLDMVQQIMAEPETASVAPMLTLDPLGVLTAQLKIQTKKGAFVELSLTADSGLIQVT